MRCTVGCESNRPIRVSARVLADPKEISENLRPELGVLHLGVELKAEQRSVSMPHRLDAAVRRTGEGRETRGEDRHLVVVGLPHLELVRQSLEQDVRFVDLHDGLPELRHLCGSRRTAKMGRHELMTRADPEDGPREGVDVIPVLAHLLRVDAHAGAPPERTRPSTSLRSETGESFGTIFVSTPRYFS